MHKILTRIKLLISSIYYFFILVHWIFRFIIFTVFIMMFFSYKYLWKSLLSILPDTTTIVEQFYLFIVIYIVTILASLIYLLIRNKDIININYKSIIILGFLSIVIVLFIKFLFLDITDAIMPCLSSMFIYLIYEFLEDNSKLPINNILSADRFSGMETGESASNRAESSRGGGRNDVSNKDEVNKSTSTSYTDEDEEIFQEMARLAKRRQYELDTLAKFIDKENIIAKNLRESEDTLKSNPGNIVSQINVGLVSKELDLHQKKFDNAYERALLRKENNLNGISTLKKLLLPIENEYSKAANGDYNFFKYKQKEKSCLSYISLFEKDNESLNKSLKIIPGGHLDVPRHSVLSELDAPRAKRPHINSTISILPNLDNRSKLNLILSKDDATKRIADNNSFIEFLMPKYEDLNRKVNRDSSNSNLLERYNEITKMIDHLQDENDKLSDKHNLSRSPTPEDN